MITNNINIMNRNRSSYISNCNNVNNRIALGVLRSRFVFGRRSKRKVRMNALCSTRFRLDIAKLSRTTPTSNHILRVLMDICVYNYIYTEV